MVCAVELILDNRLSHVLPFSFRLLSPLRNETVLLYSCYAIFFLLRYLVKTSFSLKTRHCFNILIVISQNTSEFWSLFIVTQVRELVT